MDNDPEEIMNRNKSNFRADGGEDLETELEEDGTRSGMASSLTGMVDQTLTSQDEREETARDAFDEWQDNASEETDAIVNAYNRLRDAAGTATEWELGTSTTAGELVDGLEHDSNLGVADYAQTQSEAIEGLTGTVRRFGNMVDQKESEIQEVEEDIEELEDQREEQYADVQQQITDMDDEDFPDDTTPNEYADSERAAIDSAIDSEISSLEEEISDLQSTKSDHMSTKMDAASERRVRREEAQEVYNTFASEAEQVVQENTSKLKESLGTLRELETQEAIHKDKAVEDGLLDQRQDDQAYARREAAEAYIAEALGEIDELEAAVQDHARVRDELSEITQVETRELESIYDGLADPEAVEAEIGNDEYGTEVLKQRVLEAATTITEDGYDSVRELREIADNQAGYTEE